MLQRLAKLLGKGAAAGGEALAQRQQVQQQLDQQLGMARDMAAVVENLPGELRDEVRFDILDLPLMPGQRQGGERQRRQRQEPRVAGRGLAPAARKGAIAAPQGWR